MQTGPAVIFLLSLPLCFLCRRRRAAPPAVEAGPQATSCSPWPSTHRARAPRRPFPLALDLPRSCHAPLRPQSAATSPPPWQARGRAPAPLFSRASAPGELPHPNPLTLSPLPRSKSPERRHRPPERRRARAHRRPAPPRLLCRGVEPPPAILLRGPASSGHLPSSQEHLQVRLSPLLLFPTLTLAAGDPSRRNRRSKPLPLL